LIFDHTDRGKNTIVIDDSTGSKIGVPLSDEMKDALTKANLPLATPSRGDNSNVGDAKKPGTTVANVAQQAYMADAATKVVLPMLKARNKPFVLVFWSRDPDGSQHNHGDSLNTITPGINGPTSMAGIKNADNNLAQLRKALDDLGLTASTNIIVSSDHGFSTISKESKTVRRRRSPMTTPRRISSRWASSPSIFRRRWTCHCSIPTTRMPESPKAPILRPATACWARIRPSQTSSSRPTADRT
jgi:hypothetical protein